MASTAITKLQTDLEANGLVLLGGFEPEGNQTVPALSNGARPAALLLVGSAGPAIWEHFTRSPEFALPEHPLDHWTQLVVGEIASRHGAEAAFPFGGPPYWPFQQWGLRCGSMSQSPLGVLVHPRYGPWFAFRGALLFAEPLDAGLPDDGPGPCPACAGKPCLDACPSGALTRTSSYDAEICRCYVRENANHDCAERGCLVRHACPFGRDHAYSRPQASFHMRAFTK